MTTLGKLARLIRSKNAGPFVLTFDIMFDEEADYVRVRDSGVVTRERIAQIYGLATADVQFFEFDHARALKASIPRPTTQGDVSDSDGHGGQQYAPLLDLEIP